MTSTHDRRDRLRLRRRRAPGQSLVEFALVFPIFVLLVLGLIEFTFVFNALLSVNYASRDAALAAAEAGDLDGADCVIIKAVDGAISAPAADNRIVKIEIYKTTPNGTQVGSPTVYTRNGSANTSTCFPIDGSTIPYVLTSDGYPMASRCSVLGGCDAVVPDDTVDNVAVRVTYTHMWVTPLTNFIGGGPGGLTFDRTSVMRMEPIL